MNSAVAVETKIYSADKIALLSSGPVPKHIAIIMDGNRRWARAKGLLPSAGHLQGAETLVKTVRAASELGVEVLTVYAFSTENWRRSPKEVEALMRLFKSYLLKQRNFMLEEGVRLDVIGDMKKLPKDVQRAFDESIEATKGGNKFHLVIALNYGGRDELRRTVTSIVEDCQSKKITKEDITEELISSYLDTAKWGDPDLLIRTSGESRLSNFLLWQLSYSEVFMTQVLWPDFTENDLLEILLDYQSRELRTGK